MKKILIIGKIPMPIGGVTVHVSRLLSSLDSTKINYTFLDLKYTSFPKLFVSIIRNEVIHLHSSNPYLRFLASLIAFILGKKMILTIHGNLGRFNTFKNFFDYLSVRLAKIPVVLNEESFQKARKLNFRTSLIPAFIPPLETTPLSDMMKDKILSLKEKHTPVFCTNAFNVSFDSAGRETYMILELVKLFSEIEKAGLIISDPSGAYIKYVKKYLGYIAENIIFLSSPHDFIEVIRMSDGFIRATTTDGDSLSVRESLYYNVTVIASNCVDRPDGCLLFDINDFGSLKKIISHFEPNILQKQQKDSETVNLLLNIYKNLADIVEKN